MGVPKFVAALVLVLSILQITNLPVSITGLVAASAVLCNCCGGEGSSCSKCCFIACAIFAFISFCVSMGIGGTFVSGNTCTQAEQWIEASWADYGVETTMTASLLSSENCTSHTPPASTAEWDGQDWLCYLCGIYYTVGIACIVVGLLLELPLVLLCSYAGCCAKVDKAAPGA